MQHPDDLKKVKFDTLIEGLEYAAQTSKGWRFYDDHGICTAKNSYAEVRDLSILLARKLKSLPLKRYARIGLIAHQQPSFLLAFWACQYAGFIACPLPHTQRIGAHAAYVESLTGLALQSDFDLLIGPENLRDLLQEASKSLSEKSPLVMSYEELNSRIQLGETDPLHQDDPAYFQFTSGSTAQPKGIWLSQRVITNSIASTLRDGLKARSTDRTVSWLPFSHTMGLAGHFLASICGLSTVDYLSPATVMKKPDLWVRLMSEKQAQTSFAPSFAWGMAARIANPERYDLSRFRIAGIGGDTIRLHDLDSFYEAFKNSGFRKECFLPCYGMSETVLGVAYHKAGDPLSVRSREGRELVSVGYPVAEADIIIVDEQGKELTEQNVGDIRIKAPDFMTDSLDEHREGQNPPRHDDFRITGDMGFFADGQLYITGRSKEMISFKGRKLWPQDIEQVIFHNVLKTKSIAFSYETGTEEKIVVYVENNGNLPPETLKQNISAEIFFRLGIALEIQIVSPDSLPFIGPGKPARQDVKNAYLQNMPHTHIV